MPDNPLPDAKTDATSEPVEFNFSNPPAETSRIRRRSLKAKQPGLIKPTAVAVPPTARDLEREAPPLSAEEAKQAVTHLPETRETPVTPKTEPVSKPAPSTSAPPRTTPLVSPTVSTPGGASKTAANGTAATSQTSSAPKTATGSTSPHGTRPATLYYSSSPRKESPAAAATSSSSASTSPTASPMKTIPTASSASSSSAAASSAARPAGSAASTPASSTTRPASSSAATPVSATVTRPATASSTARPSTTTDYRANIDRQSREQKSVGSLLSYVVYGLIAFFVLTAALAGYGGWVLSQRITDQSVTVRDIDAKYAATTKDLTAKLAVTQDTLTQAQAQIARQQDLIVKQQDQLNRLIATTNENTKAITAEKQARAQETTVLRGRVRDLEKNEPAPTR